MIEAQLADGTTLQFPDGTDTAVIQRVVKQRVSGAIASSPPAEPQRSPAQAAEAPVPNAPPPKPSGPPVQSLDEALAGIQAPNIGAVSPALADAGNRVVQAGVEGWQGVPTTQPIRDAVTKYGGNLPVVGPVIAPLIGPVINPLIAGVGGVAAAASGAYRGAQQLGYEIINPLLGSQAARDFVSMPDMLAGSPGATMAPRRPPIPEAPKSPPRYVQEYPGGGVDMPGMPGLERITNAITRVDDTAPPRPGRGVPEPEAGAVPEPGAQARQPGQPEPAGAQITPATELGITPQEESAYRSTAEGNKLLERQEPGVRDDKVYIEGERINEAERSQDVEVARELNSLREQTPALDKKMTADETHNANLRTRAIETTLPGQVQITAKRAERERAMEEAKPEVFRGATDANVQPIAGEIQNILNEPENLQNTQLQQYVRPLIARLVNPDGTPKIVNPVELLSWRQDVQHMTSKAAISQDKNLSRVSGILGRVLDVTDNQIELAARGYKARIRDEYRTRSREIDAMEALDAERTKLFESQNVPSYNALQAMLKRIYNARIGDDPYEPFTHVPQATLDKLYDIRDSMRRSRAVDRLGTPRGSRTSQNLGDALRIGAKAAIPAAAATLGHMMVPIPMAGEFAGLTAGLAVNSLLSARGMRQRMTRGMELTEPPRNALGP